mgnify:CR=1 FL=1
MEQKDELMGIPQLIHFNAMLITGALFLAIVLMKYLGQSNSMFVVSKMVLENMVSYFLDRPTSSKKFSL